MKRAVLIIVAVLVICPITSFGQGTPIELTDKITSLAGLWIHDPAKGVSAACGGSTIDKTIRIRVSPQGVNVESERLNALLPLDGGPVTVRDSTVATAALDAGWLAVTIRVTRPATTNVFRDVYIATGDELTIWRTFNIESPDGSLSQRIVCANRGVVVYRRQRA